MTNRTETYDHALLGWWEDRLRPGALPKHNFTKEESERCNLLYPEDLTTFPPGHKVIKLWVAGEDPSHHRVANYKAITDHFLERANRVASEIGKTVELLELADKAKADIRVNWADGENVEHEDDGDVAGESGYFDITLAPLRSNCGVGRVFEHEWIHMLGLRAHSPDHQDLMYPYCNYYPYEASENDLARLRALYTTKKVCEDGE